MPFSPTTDRLTKLQVLFPARISELKTIFDKPSAVYIDYANVWHWSDKLKWHIDVKRLKQLLDSFDNVKKVKFYYGTLADSENSLQFVGEVKKIGYELVTKPVKIMKLPIDVSGIPSNSPAVLGNFIKKPLLNKFDLETIEYLNSKLKELNEKGIKSIEIRKCNFDVEMGRDILLDCAQNGIKNFILWTGDSDFAEPISSLIKDGRKVTIFATARRVPAELSQTGVQIFDVQKIRNFISYPKEIQPEIKTRC